MYMYKCIYNVLYMYDYLNKEIKTHIFMKTFFIQVKLM